MSGKTSRIRHIATAFIHSKNLGKLNKIKFFSIWGVAFSFVVMFLSIAIILGFKDAIITEIRKNMGDIHITSYHNDILHTEPIHLDDSTIDKIQSMKNVEAIHPIKQATVFLKTETDMEGAVIRGVEYTYFNTHFKSQLQGETDISRMDPTRSIFLSYLQADKLGVTLNDSILVLFAGSTLKAKKAKIVGIYNAGIEEINDVFIYAHTDFLTHFSDIAPHSASSYFIRLNQFNALEQSAEQIATYTDIDLSIKTLYDMFPHIFEWLSTLDTNMVIILSLMIFVAVINMITTLIILVLEKIKQIAVMKSLGINNHHIQKIFFWTANYFVLHGLLRGNIIALLFFFIQNQTHFIGLDPTLYYVSYIPLKISFQQIILLNIGCWLTCLMMVFLPTLAIRKIFPSKVLRL